MRENESNPEGAWDEYRWERYLREHDARTDYYIRLLEDHLDDPRREVIIAEEMGWYHLLEQQNSQDDQARASLFFEEIEQLLEAEREQNEEALSQLDEEPDAPEVFEFSGQEEQEEFLALFGDALEADDDDDDDDFVGLDDDDDDDDDFTTHPLCDLAATYHAWLERLFLEENHLLNDPAAIRMAAYSAVCCAKLNAALEGDEYEDLGMTIAYLKRGLKAINTALGAYYDLRHQHSLPRNRLTDLHVRIFKIRDSIVDLMGYYRQEWMRRIDE